MSIGIIGDSPLVSFFSAYQTAYQQAASIVSLETLGLPTWLQAPNIPDIAEKQFIIQYIPAPLLSVGNVPTSVGIVSPLGISGALLFDVTLATAPNGVPQRVAYTNVARQTIEQSAAGFHVNEFGLAPGRLDIDAIIVYQGMEYAQVDSFFSFLRQVKVNNPLAQIDPPGKVMFTDTYLQRSLSITIETIMIEQVAGSNNQAHLVLGASILHDYSAPSLANVTQSGLPPSAANIEAAAGLLGGALSFLGVSLPF